MGPQKIYSIETDESNFSGVFPKWVNMPLRGDRGDPAFSRVMMPGHIPDAGNYAIGLGSGFPTGMETPVLRFERELRDDEYLDVLILFRPDWLLSDRAKKVFEAIDPDGLEFCETTTLLPSGRAGPKYWLCDAVRFLDALDEDRSTVVVGSKVDPETGKSVKRVDVGANGRDVFRKPVINGYHVFRLLYSPSQVFCDETLALAIERANLKGIRPYVRGILDE